MKEARAMSTLCAHPELDLSQTLQLRSPHETTALLFAVAAEIAEQSPTIRRLNYLHDVLNGISDNQDYISQLGLLLRNELSKVISDAQYNHLVWREYQNLLNPLCRSNIKPWGSKHCDPAQVFQGVCVFEEGKPCPFGDWYCANRLGAPCDHVSAALRIASRLWFDLATADTPADERRKKSRCRSFSRRHLSVWVPRIADALMNRARSDFYQIEALLIGTLSSTQV
jgi:TorA maturation chaperone TorD